MEKILDPDYLRGLSMKGEGRYTEAAVFFKRCIQNEPAFARSYEQLASVYCKMDKQSEAKAYFNKLMEGC